MARAWSFPVALTLMVQACASAPCPPVETPAAGPAVGAPESHDEHALPASLEALYPPTAQQPTFLLAMMGLAQPFEGMMVDLMQQDMEGANANFAAFRDAYARTAALVPEWQQEYPQEPVDQLAAALSQGNRDGVMAAAQAVGQVCHHCHVARMPDVQFRYHWSDPAATQVTDPVSGQPMPYGQFMQVLSASFSGIGNDLQQGQRDRAIEHARAFKSRFGALRESCTGCHQTERRYFVDAEMTAAVAALEAAVTAAQPDPQNVAQLAQTIGSESCYKCHLVHIPGTFGHRRSMGR